MRNKIQIIYLNRVTTTLSWFLWANQTLLIFQINSASPTPILLLDHLPLAGGGLLEGGHEPCIPPSYPLYTVCLCKPVQHKASRPLPHRGTRQPHTTPSRPSTAFRLPLAAPQTLVFEVYPIPWLNFKWCMGQIPWTSIHSTTISMPIMWDSVLTLKTTCHNQAYEPPTWVLQSSGESMKNHPMRHREKKRERHCTNTN